MNANELAKLLEVDSWRQQAEQIENLKQWERRHLDVIEKQQSEIEALKQIIDANNLNQNIGQFVKPTNEPVAWMNVELNGRTVLATYEFETAIPLYTHPVKELTDEEILKMAANKFHYSEYKLVIDFARSILRKASDK